ncbi:MAG: glycoside hydrolase family 31 protein [Nitrospirae bacterium]|nr:glycoside hydrolase family 31 protein [Nitrospirota bacterium]
MLFRLDGRNSPTSLGSWLSLCALAAACSGEKKPDAPQTLISTPVEARVTLSPFGIRWGTDGESLLRNGNFSLIKAHRALDAIDAQAGPCTTVLCEGTVTFSGGTALPFKMEKLDDRKWRLSLGPAPEAMFLVFSHELRPDERILGLGENFDSLLNNGRRRAMQIELANSESGNNEAHLPIPFYLSNYGYSVWVANRERGYVDVGQTTADRIRSEFYTQSLTVHVYQGASPLELLQRYAVETGTPPMPPRWAFGVHFWRNEYDRDPPGQAQKDAMEDAETLRSLDFPSSVFWIDAPYETGHNSFDFDKTHRFPDPEGLIKFLNRKGFRVIAWITQHVNHPDLAAEPDMKDYFDEAKSKNYLVRTSDGSPFISPWSRGPGAMVDFTNPEARRWYQDLAKKLLSLGIQGWKLDFGEEILPALAGEDVGGLYTFFNGLDANRMHALYKFLYHQAFYDVTKKIHGDDWFSISRAGTYGSQSLYSCIWPGDLANDFSDHTVGVDSPGIIGGLPAAVWGGINLGLSGFPFYGSDVGGFRGGTPAKNTLIRWAEFGAFSPIMQLGGGGEHRPWAKPHDEETLRILRDYARLHISLFPYLYAHAAVAHETGTPIMRALPLDFPADPRSYEAPHEYLFGGSLLVAPVVEEATSRDIYLPKDSWIDFWTEEYFTGPANLASYPIPLDRIGLFVRLPAILPLAPADVDTLADTKDTTVTTLERATQPWRIHLYPKRNSSTEFQFVGGGIVLLTAKDDITATLDFTSKRRLDVQFHLGDFSGYGIEGYRVSDLSLDPLEDPFPSQALPGSPGPTFTGEGKTGQIKFLLRKPPASPSSPHD